MINLGEVNEATSATVTVDFVDENSLAVIPTSGTYKITASTGEVIKVSTAFTPTLARHALVLTPSDNIMITANKAVENRIFTITFQYGAGKQGAGEYKYSVKRLTA